MTPPRAPLPRGPFVLLGLMTTTTILGPLLIGWVLRGGDRPNWPPDRPIEWATVLGTSGGVLALMTACLSLAWTNHPPKSRLKAASARTEPVVPRPGAEVDR